MSASWRPIAPSNRLGSLDEISAPIPLGAAMLFRGTAATPDYRSTIDLRVSKTQAQVNRKPASIFNHNLLGFKGLWSNHPS
jgi:hypothetical protein